MTHKILISLGLLVLGTILALIMSDRFVSGTWRYKITIEVQTPQGIKSGSAVHEISNSSNDIKILAFPESSNPATFRGEAVVISLGESLPPLFALPTNLSYVAFPINGPTTIEGIKHYKNLPIGKKVNLPEEKEPHFIAFLNITEPKSITLVKGRNFNAKLQKDEKVNRLEELYGKGTKIHSVTIEITDEPVTRGNVDEYLTETFWDKYHHWRKSMNIVERSKNIPTNLFKLKK